MMIPGILTCNPEENSNGSHITMWLCDLQSSRGLQYIMQFYIAPKGYDVFCLRKCVRGTHSIQEIGLKVRLLPGDLLCSGDGIASVYFYFYDSSTTIMYTATHFIVSNHCTIGECSNGGPVGNEELV